MSTLSRTFTVGDHPEVAVTVSSADVSVLEGDPGVIALEAEGSESGLEQLTVMQAGAPPDFEDDEEMWMDEDEEMEEMEVEE